MYQVLPQMANMVMVPVNVMELETKQKYHFILWINGMLIIMVLDKQLANYIQML